MFKIKFNTIAITLVAVLIFSISVFAAGFPDVMDDNPYKEAIEYLSDLQIFYGYEDGLFHPDGMVFKSEVTLLIVRMLGLESEYDNNTGTTVFFDVPPDHWAVGFINILTDRGILDETRNLYPDNYATFTDVIKMIVNAKGYKQEALSSDYYSVAENHGFLYNLSAVSDSNITRGELAQIIYNAMGENNHNEMNFIINGNFFSKHLIVKENDIYYFPMSKLHKVVNNYSNSYTYKEYEGKVMIYINGIVQVLDSLDSNIITKNNQKYISADYLAETFGSNYYVDDRKDLITVIDLKAPPQPIANRLLKGTISLPNNEVAPQGGLQYEITAQTLYGSNYYNALITINANENSAEYEIAIDNLTNEYLVSYYRHKTRESYEYAERGYYNPLRTTSRQEKTIPIVIGEQTVVDFKVVPNIIISGTIEANGNVGVAALANNTYIDSRSAYNNTFKLYIPIDISEVYLICYPYGDTNSQQVYYTKNGSTVFAWQKEIIKLVGVDITDINFNISPTKKISGDLIYSKSTATILDSGEIYAISKNHPFNKIVDYFYINGNDENEGYVFNIPITNDNVYVLYFSNKFGYRGYVDSNGKIVAEMENAMELDISSGDIMRNIDIDVKTVSGKISLPNNQLAPNGGINLNLFTGSIDEKNGQFYIAQQIGYGMTIPMGENFIDYCITIPFGIENIGIGYLLNSFGDFRYAEGYYVDGETKTKIDRDPKIAEYTDINLTIIEKDFPSGMFDSPFVIMNGVVCDYFGIGKTDFYIVIYNLDGNKNLANCYLAFYDKDNNLLEMRKLNNRNEYSDEMLLFTNVNLTNVKRIKAFIWNDSLEPLSMAFDLEL